MLRCLLLEFELVLPDIPFNRLTFSNLIDVTLIKLYWSPLQVFIQRQLRYFEHKIGLSNFSCSEPNTSAINDGNGKNVDITMKSDQSSTSVLNLDGKGCIHDRLNRVPAGS